MKERQVVGPPEKTTLTKTNFIRVNGKPADINGLKRLRNPPSWLLIILVVLKVLALVVKFIHSFINIIFCCCFS